MFRKLPLVTAAFVAILAFTGIAQAKSSILYSLTATNVQVAKANTGGYRVSIPAKAKVSWFTDRPERRAGFASAADLVAGWSANGFDTTPPNAAFVMTHDGATNQMIVVLKKAERKGTSVVFTAMQLPHGTMLGMQTTASLKPGRYPRAELFVDDGTTPPCGKNAHYTSTIDCTLSVGNGPVGFVNPTPTSYRMTVSVSNVGPGALPVAVTLDHLWGTVSLCSFFACPITPNDVSETHTTPFTRDFGAVPARSNPEMVTITAPTDPTVVLHVQGSTVPA